MSRSRVPLALFPALAGGLLGLSVAASPPAPLPASAASDWKTISVQAQEPEAAAEELMLKLREQMVEVSFQDVTLEDAAEWLKVGQKLNLVIDPETIDEFGHEEIDLQAKASVARTLDMLCRTLGHGLEWTVRDGAVLLGCRLERPVTKFYDVGPLLARDAAGREEAELEELVEHDQDVLMDLLYSCTADMEDWDQEQVSVRMWNGLLCVNQTPEVHEEVHAFLERLLNDGRAPPSPGEDPAASLRQGLATRIPELQLEDSEIDEAVSALTAFSGLPILVQAELREEFDSYGFLYTLHLRDMDVAQILRWLCRSAEFPMHFQVEPEAVYLCLGPGRSELAFHEIASLLPPSSHPEDAKDELIDLLNSTHENEVQWEIDHWLLSPWRDLLIVRHVPEVQDEIRRYVDGLRQALARRG